MPDNRPVVATGAQPATFIALAGFLAICAATYYRLYFGVNFADETYYIAIPMRFVLGDVPFRDEATTLFSMFSFISYPFFKLYRALNGTNEGIILFARHLYFAFLLGVAAILYRIVRQLVASAEAILIVSCAVAFIPFNIQGINYNSLTAGFLTAGLFVGAWGSQKHLPHYETLSGFLMAMCVIAYPPMLIVALVALLCMTSQRRRSFVPSCIGALVAILCLAPLLRYAELDTIRSNIEYVCSLGVQGGNLKKLMAVIGNSFSHLWIGIIICSIVCKALLKNHSPKVRAAAALIPLILALTNRFHKGPVAVASHGFVLALALIGPWIYRGIHERDRKFFLTIWIPSLVAAIVMGYSSSNGYLNSGIGFLAGGLVSLIMLTMLLGNTNEEGKSSRDRFLQLSMIAMTAGIMVYYQYASVYWESSIGKLNTTIASGPYKHLRTTPEKARFINQLGADIKVVEQDAGSIVFYYNFPAGYLFSDLKPATNSVWLFSPHSFHSLNTTQLKNRYSQPEKQPDVIFRFEYTIVANDAHMAAVHVPEHPIDILLASGDYRVGLIRPEYVVYCKKQKNLGL